MRFPIPLSPSYCSHWGLWEAVREIYQNALDQEGAEIKYVAKAQRLEISSATGHLSPETLVLGNTSKTDDPTKRGKFGEGYKIALLVLARLGHKVCIYNGDEIWIARIKHSDLFNTEMLTVDTMSANHKDGVRFYIEGISAENMALIHRNIRPTGEFFNAILEDAAEKGRIYVGGLYVNTVPDYQYGYAFRPDKVQLDRDRGMIEGFDLAWQTSALWIARGHSYALSALLEKESPEVEYVSDQINTYSHSTFVSGHYTHFTSRHGSEAVPVSTQQEIQKATAAGMKWVLVPEKVKAMLRLVKSWVIPSRETPLERLHAFKKEHAWRLSGPGKEELDEIIKMLETH